MRSIALGVRAWARSPPSRYRSTLATRPDDKTRDITIVIQQRVHEEDLVGFLLEQEGWTHLNLPAIAEERQVIPLGPHN